MASAAMAAQLGLHLPPLNVPAHLQRTSLVLNLPQVFPFPPSNSTFIGHSMLLTATKCHSHSVISIATGLTAIP